MKKNTLTLLTLTLLCFISTTGFGQSVQQTLKSAGLKTGKQKPLFNGHDFGGWYKFLHDQGKDKDPDQVFKIEDGIVHISGYEYGCITTNDEYSNYRLDLEFKWGAKTFKPRVDAARDNGILIHSQGKDGAFSGNWMYSIECQVIEGGTGDFLVVADGSDTFSITCPVAPQQQNGTYIYQADGDTVSIKKGRINWFARDSAWKDVKDFRGARDVEKPVGEWNKITVIAYADDIYYYLNGVLVNRAMKVRPTVGRIQIQSEGAEMFVRNAYLSPLTKK